MRKNIKRDASKLKEAVEALKNGMPASTASDVYGIPRTTIRRHYKNNPQHILNVEDVKIAKHGGHTVSSLLIAKWGDI